MIKKLIRNMVLLHKFSYFCNLMKVGVKLDLIEVGLGELIEDLERKASRELTWDWRQAMRVLVDKFGAESGRLRFEGREKGQWMWFCGPYWAVWKDQRVEFARPPQEDYNYFLFTLVLFLDHKECENNKVYDTGLYHICLPHKIEKAK